MWLDLIVIDILLLYATYCPLSDRWLDEVSIAKRNENNFMLKKYKILKKGDFKMPLSLEEKDAKEVMFSLVQDGFSVEPNIFRALNDADALDKFDLAKLPTERAKLK